MKFLFLIFYSPEKRTTAIINLTKITNKSYATLRMLIDSTLAGFPPPI